MIDRALLVDAINASGLKRKFIAEQLNLTYMGFKKKLDGKNEFRETEIRGLISILHLNKTDRDKIFFAKKVE